MRKLLTLLGFVSFIPLFLLFTTFFLRLISIEQTTTVSGVTFFSSPHPVAYAALPDNLNVVTTSIGLGDVRVGKVFNFLQSYNSPLSSYSDELVQTADKYGIDYEWIPAIAMQESGGCAKVIGDSFNCWGYGIYTGHMTKFEDYSQGIDVMGQYLAKEKALGLDTPEKLGALYNPSNTSDWVGKVSLFISQMQ